MMRILLGLPSDFNEPDYARILRQLQTAGEVKVVLRHGSKLAEATPEAINDEVEWYTWQKVGDPVLHIELTKWADILVIVPLTAHCLTQLVHGLCDDLLTSVARAWGFDKPMLMVPGMPVVMWQQPLTREHLSALAVHENCHVALQSGVHAGAQLAQLSDREAMPDLSTANVVEQVHLVLTGNAKAQDYPLTASEPL